MALAACYPLPRLKFSGRPVDAEINLVIDVRRMLYYGDLYYENDTTMTPFYRTRSGAILTTGIVLKQSIVAMDSNDHWRFRYCSLPISRATENEDYIKWPLRDWEDDQVNCRSCLRLLPVGAHTCYFCKAPIDETGHTDVQRAWAGTPEGVAVIMSRRFAGRDLTEPSSLPSCAIRRII